MAPPPSERVPDLAAGNPAAPFGRPLDLGQLAAIATRFASERTVWRARVRHDPLRRWYVRLAWEADHEVWLLGWTPGQTVGLHDHGGSAGAFVVTEGELLEEHLESGEGIDLRRTRCRRGAVRRFPPRHVHDLWNPGPGVATSIHVYSPPLGSMTFYAYEKAASIRPTRIEHLAAGSPARHSPARDFVSRMAGTRMPTSVAANAISGAAAERASPLRRGGF
jgi:predicted metal-dependent enzyme (double-stranded beta helix superfamily)